MSHASPYSVAQALGSLELIDGCGIGVQHHLLDRGRWMISPIFLEKQIVWTVWKFVNIEVWYSLFTEWGRQQKQLTFRGCNLPTAKTHQKLSPAPRHCKFSSLFVKLLPRASEKIWKKASWVQKLCNSFFCWKNLNDFSMSDFVVCSVLDLTPVHTVPLIWKCSMILLENAVHLDGQTVDQRNPEPVIMYFIHVHPTIDCGL